MGIDLPGRGRSRKSVRKTTTATNGYQQLLVELYSYLARRTDSKINRVILKRLVQARQFQRPISYSRLSRFMRRQQDASKYIVAVVGTVVDDTRDMEPLSGMKVCALRVTEGARTRMLNNGCEIYTFDQLAQMAPTGENVILFRGSRLTEKKKHFGTPGAIGDHAKPFVRSKGRKFEKARGRRSSRAYKTK
mmetsp:Transcript_1058/g.1647  ORF Transcript_1058/g.1647 Transcript_1058/m.1647 type:complete len:191 (+) Transcript_1058:61-633(+)|eukprot:CAMPEP_0117423530 /NCGR_PEP_ID=MMETSP0758-20121206/4131_1 /TAXON_ID=63605 /ORGANISM="Percolomonas cosmopolitus, Strain AE-1 (ATCC 50343)" /LENGTH=190 /DNA_ID=CAMNT_0005206765 /DNA_START=43 /DNA_END=615 /DNA_ORIENTATION=+